MNRPNLLFVFADQWRGSDLGCAGNRDVRTPRLDRLAAEGVRLTRCYASHPVCTPNRAIMLTGQHSVTTGVIGNDLPLPPEAVTFGEVARRHDYATGYIGKWHLDGMPRGKFTPPGPRRHGFDFWAAYNCFHDYFHPRYYRDSPEMVEAPGRYEPEVQTDLALDFLRERQDDGEPFCLFLSYGPPHDPYRQVPERYRSLYDPSKLALRPNVQADSQNPLVRGMDCREALADYYAAVTALDTELGRLLDALDRQGLTEDTLVVMTSDHGDMLWSNGWMKKQLPYEESVHIPLVARWPAGLPAGVTTPTLFSSCDLLPTLASLLGWELPGPVDGRDLSASWRGAPIAENPSNVLLANTTIYDEGRRQGVPEWRAIRTARHTYAERVGHVPWLLFDNQKDPFQQNNLVADNGCRGLREKLAGELRLRLTQAGDPFLDSAGMRRHCRVEKLWEERQERRDSFLRDENAVPMPQATKRP